MNPHDITILSIDWGCVAFPYALPEMVLSEDMSFIVKWTPFCSQRRSMLSHLHCHQGKSKHGKMTLIRAFNYLAQRILFPVVHIVFSSIRPHRHPSAAQKKKPPGQHKCHYPWRHCMSSSDWADHGPRP